VSTASVVERGSTLDCLEETFAELSNSFTTLHQNFQGIKQVHESLNEFNKSFSGFLYGIKMNAHCIEFSEREADLFKENQSTPIATPVRRIKTPTPVSRIKTPAQPPPPKKKKINKALAIKTLIKKIVDSLPPKYRDQHQANRKNVEMILRLLFENPSEGKYIQDIVKCTELARGRCIEYLNVLINNEYAAQ
ncbi:19820_t:CDS:2, partial [Racocetra persica]